MLESVVASADDPVKVLVLEMIGGADLMAPHPVLRKPFSIPDLAITVREALDDEA